MLLSRNRFLEERIVELYCVKLIIINNLLSKKRVNGFNELLGWSSKLV